MLYFVIIAFVSFMLLYIGIAGSEELDVKSAPSRSPTHVRPMPKPIPKPLAKPKVKKLVTPKPKPQKRKVVVSKDKYTEFVDILQAIGFNKKESEKKVTQILKQEPKITQEDFLRKATK